jgi:hypothetical protein
MEETKMVSPQVALKTVPSSGDRISNSSRLWAAEAQVSPLDRVSTDAKDLAESLQRCRNLENGLPRSRSVKINYYRAHDGSERSGEFSPPGNHDGRRSSQTAQDTTIRSRVRDLLTPAEIDSSNDSNNTRAGHGIRVNLHNASASWRSAWNRNAVDVKPRSTLCRNSRRRSSVLRIAVGAESELRVYFERALFKLAR